MVTKTTIAETVSQASFLVKLVDGCANNAAWAVVLAIMTITNLATYASMKAKLTTSMWQYDILKMHTDSIMEVYNINKNYSRITSYE